MASPVVTPNVSAPASAPAATSTPAAAATVTSTPVAAPVSTPAAAPVAAPVTDASATTAIPATKAPLVQQPNETDSDFFIRGMLESTKEPEAAAASTEVEAPPAATEVTDDGSEVTEDGEEKPATEEPAATEADDDYDEFEDAPGPLSPKDLNQKIATIPGLKEAIEADPDFKNSLFASSRLAAETAAFKAVFINPEEARVAAAGNAEFSKLSSLVTSIEKPEDAQGFYSELMNLSIIHDENGKPILDKDGKPVSDGTVGRLIHHTGALFLNHFGGQADANNDPELAAAVDILRARAFGGPASTDQGNLTEEQQARQVALDAQETALKAEKAATQKAKIVQFNQRVTDGIDAATNSKIDSLLSRTDIPEAERAAVADKIRQSVYELVAANPQFQNEQDALMRRVMGENTLTARVGLGKRWVDALLGGVAKKAIAEAGAKIMARQAKKQQAQAARVEASRSEAPGTLRTARPVEAPSPQQAAALAQANLRTKLGREPSFAESLAEVNRMRATS